MLMTYESCKYVHATRWPVQCRWRLCRTIIKFPNLPTPKFSFSSDFSHFILNIFGKLFSYDSNYKKNVKKENFQGDVPPEFPTGGTRPPVPLLSTLMKETYFTNQCHIFCW